MKYVLSIDQSTQGTKVLLLDGNGSVVSRAYRTHRQIIDHQGYVSHDLHEIWLSLLAAAEEAIGDKGERIAAIGIANQRETSCLWNEHGPLTEAVVWQCARAQEIAEELRADADLIRQRTGLPLSPYFPAAKYAWLLRNHPVSGKAYLGTVDSYLIWKMTGNVLTDYSNASRTQLFDLKNCVWDQEICDLFGIPVDYLPEIVDSDALFGHTDLEGLLSAPVPVHAALGDSHAAMYAHHCTEGGQCKVTYGTGSSVMMNAGEQFILSNHGLSSSVAWSVGGKLSYVLEGNINYSCAVITWLREIGLIAAAKDVGRLAAQANPADTTVLIPAFSGLSTPYWMPDAKARIVGMTRTTGRNEICRAAEDSIALQIADVLDCMREDSGKEIRELRTDGGATGDAFLMQLQADLADARLLVPSVAEFSAIGAGYMAGIAAGVFGTEVFENLKYHSYSPKAEPEKIKEKRKYWSDCVMTSV